MVWPLPVGPALQQFPRLWVAPVDAGLRLTFIEQYRGLRVIKHRFTVAQGMDVLVVGDDRPFTSRFTELLLQLIQEFGCRVKLRIRSAISALVPLKGRGSGRVLMCLARSSSLGPIWA